MLSVDNVVNAVYHSDSINTKKSKADIANIVCIAIDKLGFFGVTQKGQLDLGNGHYMEFQTFKIDDANG
jgi:hypothetical protein